MQIDLTQVLAQATADQIVDARLQLVDAIERLGEAGHSRQIRLNGKARWSKGRELVDQILEALAQAPGV
jgi:hypothetical protein